MIGRTYQYDQVDLVAKQTPQQSQIFNRKRQTYSYKLSTNQEKSKTFSQEILNALLQEGCNFEQLGSFVHVNPLLLTDILNSSTRKLLHHYFKRLLSFLINHTST